MSDKNYIKDDGTECELCKEQSGYCHIHADNAGSGDSRFSIKEGQTHCPECESPIEPDCALLREQQYNPVRVNINIILQCDCTQLEITHGQQNISKEQLPDAWR